MGKQVNLFVTREDGPIVRIVPHEGKRDLTLAQTNNSDLNDLAVIGLHIKFWLKPDTCDLALVSSQTRKSVNFMYGQVKSTICVPGALYLVVRGGSCPDEVIRKCAPVPLILILPAQYTRQQHQQTHQSHAHFQMPCCVEIYIIGMRNGYKSILLKC